MDAGPPVSDTPEVNLASMRCPYENEAFTEDRLASREPVGQFRHWFDQVCATSGIPEPNAMCLSTATTDGRPSARFVLLKGFGGDGFRFFTNFDSRKAAELDANPRAALTFHWAPLHRSVRVEGTVQRLSEDVSETYFRSRPVDYQVGAALSPQSQVIASRQVLVQQEQELMKRHGAPGSEPVPRPHWGGYIVQPTQVEFWQGQVSRIHDRIRFRRRRDGDEEDSCVHAGDDGWVFERLAP